MESHQLGAWPISRVDKLLTATTLRRREQYGHLFILAAQYVHSMCWQARVAAKRRFSTQIPH